MRNRFSRAWADWGVMAIVGMLVLAFWVLTMIVSQSQKGRLLDDSAKELAQLNNAVSQHAADLFREVKTGLRVIELWFQANPGIDPRTDARFVELVAALRRSSNGLVDPRMISGDGKLFYIPTPDGKPLADVSDRDYFREQLRQGPQQLYIGNPVKSRVTGRWGIPISWRLGTPVAGIHVIFANVDLERLNALHEEMRLKPNGSIVVTRDDGIVLARTPYN